MYEAYWRWFWEQIFPQLNFFFWNIAGFFVFVEILTQFLLASISPNCPIVAACTFNSTVPASIVLNHLLLQKEHTVVKHLNLLDPSIFLLDMCNNVIKCFSVFQSLNIKLN